MAESRFGSCFSDLCFFGCLGLLIIVGCGGGWFLWTANRQQEPVPEPVMIDLGEPDPEPPAPELDTPEPIQLTPEPQPAETPKPPAKSDEIPIEFPAAADGDFKLDIESSVLRRFPTSYSYELKARLVIGPVIARKIVAQLELLDPDGAQLGTLRVDVLPGGYEVLPGDVVPIQSLIYKEAKAPAAATARLTFLEAEFEPETGPSVPGADVETVQGPSAPAAGIEIRIRERSRKIEADFLKPKNTSVRLVLEIGNVGTRDIEMLKIFVEPYDSGGGKLPVADGIIKTDWPPNVSPISFPQYPRWKPGERRVKPVTLHLPGIKPDQVAGYRVGIFEAE